MNASSWFTPDGVMAAVALLGFAGAIAGAYLHVKDKRLDEKMEDQANAVKVLKDEHGKRLDGLHAEAKDAKEALEARLANIERTYISRAEHAEFRAEILNAVRDVGEGVRQGLADLGREVKELVNRVAKVEAQ